MMMCSANGGAAADSGWCLSTVGVKPVREGALGNVRVGWFSLHRLLLWFTDYISSLCCSAPPLGSVVLQLLGLLLFVRAVAVALMLCETGNSWKRLLLCYSFRDELGTYVSAQQLVGVHSR